MGQWLQTRDVESTPIDAMFVAVRDDPKFAEFDAKRNRFRRLRRRSERNRESLSPEERQELAGLLKEMTAFRERMQGVDFSGELRASMREETERHVEYVLTENRPLTELIDCDYAFLNQRLAKHYGVEGIADLPDRGVKRVALPAGSARGGILTEGAVLAVTSNPDRTSPVKRGLFVLENVLGSPPPPPPPNVPPLDESAEGQDGKPLTMRESLERHRADPLCHSCHARMDPIGLALENFNAMGSWREAERGSPIDSSGTLASGEKVRGIEELKKVLAEKHAREFYACLVEKLLTYAVGRGLDYNDLGTVDAIVDGIVADGGRSGSLMTGVVNCAAFQRRRGDDSGRLRESVSAAPAASPR